MKSRINIASALIASIFIGMLACDKIEAPYRDEDNAAASKGVVYLSDSEVIIDGDTFSFAADNSTPMKKVLAEDYTGMLCGNCPYAGEELNDSIQPDYGEQLIVISVHAGFFAVPCPSGFACPPSRPAGALETDYRTPVGDEWDALFGNSNAGNPNGLIDRMDFPTGQHIQPPAEWASKIQTRSLLSPAFALRMQGDYDQTTKKLKIAVQSRAIGDQSAAYKLQLVITEDSIIDWQYWYPPVTPSSDPDYLHRHVLRKPVNSNFGEDLSSTGFTNGELALRGYNATIDPAWEEKNIHVVAFIYDAVTYEVKQVERVSLIP
ncbi:MAG: Omp28-related outer membrane protein [Bacteroidia bacterium]|nr:Omp28-related outer membrane protein [Bacteroidia bacterium]